MASIESDRHSTPDDTRSEQGKLFPLFAQLAAEIRVMVWRHALWNPNIVQLCFHSLDPGYGFEMYLRHRVVPPLLQTCRESRRCALEVYPDKFFEQEETAIMTYTNYEIDTLYLGTAVMHMHMDWLSQALFMNTVPSLDVDRVRHLAIDVNYWKSWDADYMLSMISGFGNLESLTLTIEDHGESEEPVRFVDLDEAVDGDAEGLWDYDGEAGGVVSACREILGKLPTEYDNDEDIRETWPKLPVLGLKKVVGKIFGQKKSEEEALAEDKSLPDVTVHHGAILRIGY